MWSRSQMVTNKLPSLWEGLGVGCWVGFLHIHSTVNLDHLTADIA